MKKKTHALSRRAAALDGGKLAGRATPEGSKPQKRKRALRVPVVKEGERLPDLLPAEVAFIHE